MTFISGISPMTRYASRTTPGASRWSMLSERATLATIAIIGISPPSGVGAVIICIIKPNTNPAIKPAIAPAVILERMILTSFQTIYTQFGLH